MKYKALPYCMRYKAYLDSPFVKMYDLLRSWSNAPMLFAKQSFFEHFGYRNSKYGYKFASKYPELATKYFHLKYEYFGKDKA